MEKNEIKSFLGKIKAYYRYFDNTNKETVEEWIKRLTPYRTEDINKRFEEHLKGEDRHDPPMLHILISNLSTEEQQRKTTPNDYIIRCNLCGKEMGLSHYDNVHYERCLLIKSLVKVLEDRGEHTSYEELEKYDTATLDKVWLKYMPITKKIDW